MDDEVNDDHGDDQDHTPASLVTIRLCGPSQSECGYCHGKRASIVQKSPQESSVTAMGLWMEAAEKLASSSSSSATLLQQQQQQHRQQLQQQTALYEQFVCRGWRRSGRYLYKPDNWASCCPAFTIRLKVQQFAPTKSQRRVVQKMKRLLEPTTLRQATQDAPSRKHPPHVVFNTSVILESGVVTLLQDWTREILEKYWMDHIKSDDQSSSLPLPSWWNDIMPVTFKLQPSQNTKKPNKQEKQHEQLSTTSPQQKKRPIAALAGSNPTTMVTDDDDDQRQQQQSHQQHQHILSTTICAALAGRSRGQIRRDDVSIHVADALQRQWEQHIRITSQNDHRFNNLVLIRKIGTHIKSGHVLVHLVVIDNVDDNNKHEQSSTGAIKVGDQDMADGDKHHQHGKHSRLQINKVDDNVDDEDAFASWWKTEAVLRQGCWAWSQKKQQRPPQSSQTHQLQVSTMSVWDSALDPDVFRLYTLYQHEVHDESDVLAYEYSSADSGDVDERDNENSNDSNQEHDHGNTSAGDEQTGDEEWILQSKTMLEAAFLRHCASNPQRQERIRKAYESFVHFLVDTPFSNGSPEPQESKNNAKADTCEDNRLFPPGSYHQHYRIDGALVAVGVVDLLPQGLSSVYLFYHPSFSHRHVALGKYCSWREIEFAQQCEVPYYYLGYYIESCPKMRYKAEYQPSELLCPVTYQWVDAKVAQSIIQANSPLHLCCQLHYPPEPSKKPTLFESSRDSHPLDKRELFNFCHPQPGKSVHAILNSILLDVGLPKTVTFRMLQAAAQDIVRPLLQALFNELDSQIVEQCIVKLV